MPCSSPILSAYWRAFVKKEVTTQVHATCELSSLELSQTLALSRTKNKFIFIWAQIE